MGRSDARYGRCRRSFNLDPKLWHHCFDIVLTKVVEDDAEAAKWYRKAADQGAAIARSKLGFLYEHGQGVVQGDAEAAKWYRKAADQGDAKAQFNLGVLYASERGVAQDVAEAAK